MTAWVRVLTSSLRKIACTWVLTVASDKSSSRQMALFDLPSIMRSSTSRCRADSGSRCSAATASGSSSKRRSSASRSSEPTSFGRKALAPQPAQLQRQTGLGRAGHHHDRGARARPAQALERQHAAAVAQHQVQHDQIDVGMALALAQGQVERTGLQHPQLGQSLTQQQRKALAKQHMVIDQQHGSHDQTPPGRSPAARRRIPAGRNCSSHLDCADALDQAGLRAVKPRPQPYG